MNDIYDALDFIGEADTRTLDTLSEAIRSRRKSLRHMEALANVAEIQPGDRAIAVCRSGDLKEVQRLFLG